MSFKASTSVPVTGYAKAKALALAIKKFAAQRAEHLRTDSNADAVLATFHDLRRYRDELLTVKDITGLAQYAKDQEADSAYDIIAEFIALINAVEAVMANILLTFPTDVNGYLLEKQFNAQGTYDFRQFSTVQLAPLVVLLEAVNSTVS